MKKENNMPQTNNDTDSIISVISSQLGRYTNDKSVDSRNILLLIAALGLLNLKDKSNLAVATARKLSTGVKK